MRKYFLILVFMLSTLLTGCGGSSDPISIREAWARFPSANGAVYMKITNRTDKDVAITGVRTVQSIAETVELHETYSAPPNANAMESMMSMRKVDRIVVPKKSSVELRPGGYHIMLMNVKQPVPKAGEIFELQLETEDDHKLGCSVLVKS